MSRTTDPITAFDLDAFVDEQLDVARRIEVEDYLSHHPPAAARVMADLRTRDELRLALRSAGGRGRPQTLEAARRLQRGLARTRLAARLRRVAAIGVFVTAGWFAHAELGPFAVTESAASPTPPAFVEDAVMSHRTAMVRAGMRSQPVIASYDPAEIRAVTRIVMPELPRNWRVLDVQVFPSKAGPSVEMALDAGRLGAVSLFAMHHAGFAVVEPAVAHDGGESIAYWQMGELAFALTGRGAAEELERAARKLADSLY